MTTRARAPIVPSVGTSFGGVASCASSVPGPAIGSGAGSGAPDTPTTDARGSRLLLLLLLLLVLLLLMLLLLGRNTKLLQPALDIRFVGQVCVNRRVSKHAIVQSTLGLRGRNKGIQELEFNAIKRFDDLNNLLP